MSDKLVYRYKFRDGVEEQPLNEFMGQMTRQFTRMANSDDPELSLLGREQLKRLAAESAQNTEDRVHISRASAIKGRAGAEARWGNRKTINAIIQTLAKKKDAMGDPVPPSELWPNFYAALDVMQLNPEESGEPLSNQIIEYEGGVKTYESFKRMVNRSRQ